MPRPAFNLDEHLFYMLARDFFSRTRQGTFTRSQVVQRLEKLQDEVKRRLAEREAEREEQLAQCVDEVGSYGNPT